MADSVADNAGSNEIDVHEGTAQGRYLPRKKGDLARFTINAFITVCNEDEPIVLSSIFGEHRQEWHASMQKEVCMLEEMSCWDVVSKPKDMRVRHTKFVLKQKYDAAEEMKTYEMRLVVWGNDKYKNRKDTFSPVPDLTEIKLIMCIAKQRDYHRRHFNFQNEFWEGKMDRSVYAE